MVLHLHVILAFKRQVYRLTRVGRPFSGTALLDLYRRKISEKTVKPDPHQEETLLQLQELQTRIEKLDSDRKTGVPTTLPDESKGSFFFGSLFGSDISSTAALQKSQEPPSSLASPTGAYLWGGPGCGKTFMMDMFHDSLAIQAKKRVHFNNFMIEVHKGIHAAKKQGTMGPLESLVSNILEDAYVICLDEFQVLNLSYAPDFLLPIQLMNIMNIASSLLFPINQ